MDAAEYKHVVLGLIFLKYISEPFEELHAKLVAEKAQGEYADVAGFCKSAPLDEVRKHGHVLTPGRYVGAEVQEDDGEPFEEKMKRLTATLREQQAEAKKMDASTSSTCAPSPRRGRSGQSCKRRLHKSPGTTTSW